MRESKDGTYKYLGWTYRHFVNGINNVVHLVSCDEAVIVQIIKFKCPCGKFRQCLICLPQINFPLTMQFFIYVSSWCDWHCSQKFWEFNWSILQIILCNAKISCEDFRIIFCQTWFSSNTLKTSVANLVGSPCGKNWRYMLTNPWKATTRDYMTTNFQ